MKFFAFLLLGAPVISAATVGSSRFARDELLPFNPPISALDAHIITEETIAALLPAPVVETNAKRLSQGLPPLPPKAHVRSNTPSRITHAARAGPSPTIISGVLSIVDRSSSIKLGYVSSSFNFLGQYFGTRDLNAILEVTATVHADGTPFDLVATNPAVSTIPFLGGVAGFSNTSPDLSSGSFNYVYLAGTTQTPPQSVPVKQVNSFTAATTIEVPVESAIWTFDPATKRIIPHWINTDGSAPEVQLVYMPVQNAFAIVGDYVRFATIIGPGAIIVDLVIE